MADTAAAKSLYASCTTKRRRNFSDQPLLSGLPDDVAELCLSRVHPTLLFSVCSSWRRYLYSPSPSFPPFFSLYALLASSSSLHHIHFSSFDPISSRWCSLPPPDPPLCPLLLCHHSFLSRRFPVQTLSTAGKLLVLAATAPGLLPALARPLLFSPSSLSWSLGPPLSPPRRWCAAAALGDAVIAASGLGSEYRNDVARSVEMWDLNSGWKWEKKRPLRDAKLSREAVEGVGWRGKVCLVNAAKEGMLYDVVWDEWEEMPPGMVAGWRGPAAAMDEEVIYTVDEAKGTLGRYDPAEDEWEVVVESEQLRGAEQMAAGGGRVCIVCGGGGGSVVVVDVVAKPARLWMVDQPPGYQAVAVHILPRMPVWQ